MSKSDIKRIQTTLEVVTDNLDDLVNELLPDNNNAKEFNKISYIDCIKRDKL
jgi:hypothetical protein